MMNYFEGVFFSQPGFFWLFLLFPLVIGWYIYNNLRSSRPSLTLSSLRGFEPYRPSLRQRMIHAPFVLRMLVAGLLVTALARPQSSSKGKNISTEGIDIVVSFDISGSMLAEDFKPNRIEAAKKVAMEFIDARPDDRMGLVVFAGESFTQCPLTTDHAVLKNLLKEVRNNMLIDGTALGEGLATAITRIKDSKAKSKVIILMTDGVNNSGSVAPITAAEIAKAFHIRVYTIGIGTMGMAPYPFKTAFGTQYQQIEVQIDEATMEQIAQTTDGKYFRATGNTRLKKIYDDIDRMEKTKINVTEFSHHSEEFLPLALLAGIFLLLESILRFTVLKSIP